ncbi:hypothetical protein Tco_0589278 [Tanacetum coccineum]
MAGKGCALHHWVHDVIFNVSNQLVILTAYVLTRLHASTLLVYPILAPSSVAIFPCFCSGGSGGGSVDVVSVVSVTLDREHQADAQCEL